MQCDCFHVGRLSGTKGTVWQYTAIDVASAYTWAELAAARTAEPAPVAQRVGRELGFVVATDVAGRRPAPGYDPVERGGGGGGVDAPGIIDIATETGARASKSCCRMATPVGMVTPGLRQ